MAKEKRDKHNNIIALTGAAGAAALLAFALNFAISSLNSRHKKKELKGSKVQINLSPSRIIRLADQLIAKSKAVHDAVASVPLDKVSYNNVISPLVDLEIQQFPLLQSCIFPKMVSSSEDVRKASAEAERKIDAHADKLRKREDLYRVIKAVAVKGEKMSTEAKRYTQFLVKDFERNGLNLTLAKREELQRLKTQLDDLSIQYIRNINDDGSFLLFNEMDLLGLPLQFLQSLDKAENGKLKISLGSHHLLPVLEFCKVGTTRKSVAVAYGRRSELNLSVLQNLVHLRHKFARLLGYSNYADYTVELRMAKFSRKVFEFLEDISAGLTELAAKELDLLKGLKKEEEGEHPFGIEDLQYYVKRVEEKQFDLDFGVVKQYFPVDVVLSGVLKICQDLYGLRFEEIADSIIWHHDINVYSVYDLRSCELLGYLYLDLYKREGKYGHTCVVPLQYGSSQDGSRQVHHICNRASFPKFSGLRLDPDFVEIPAQVLENWCYDNIALKMISGYHEDITKPINDEICDSLRRWRSSFSALKLKQEILYCLFDQIVHSNENVDIIGLFKHLHPKVMGGLQMLEGTNPASCYSRLAIGYEAVCYSRIWSEVFAADIFASKFRDNLFDQNVGTQFREKVLGPGGAKDPVEILTDFLGREPSIQAFIDSKSDFI
uniref:Peptidase M3A/M3B catalytic domain-containing protein n=1 Tax=Daucus carota subsp. sativus TaxID=79200 RepID=A0A175YRG8_DAUCS